jgi:hypothetical protein
MSEAAIIPSILERIDTEGVDAVGEDALGAFQIVLDRLDTWVEAFRSSASESSPLFWPRPTDDAGKQHIWFQNITVANALTHLWAFRVICLRNIDQLRASCSPCGSRQGAKTRRFDDETGQLSVMICQSIQYLMQDRMKLFGPVSVTLPLRTAYETFEDRAENCMEELNWCKEIVKNIHNRGYVFISSFFPDSWVDSASARDSQGRVGGMRRS